MFKVMANCLKTYNKTIIEFGLPHDIVNYQNLVSLLSAEAEG